MEDWKKLNASLQKKKNFYSHLKIEDFIDADYIFHFESINIGGHHDLNVSTDYCYLMYLTACVMFVLKHMG